MSDHPVYALIGNSAILISMVLIFDLAILRWRSKFWKLRKVLSGLLLGGMALAVMGIPWKYSTEVIIDTRSIVLTISGLFFGLTPTIIAMLIASIGRYLIGGLGAWTGISVIITTGSLGIIWRYIRKKDLQTLRWYHLYFFGLAIHAIMMLLQLTIPQGIGLEVFFAVGAPVMVIYPVAFMLIGILMVDRLHQDEISWNLRQTKEQLDLVFEASNISFFTIDVEKMEITLSSDWPLQLGYQHGEIDPDYDLWKSHVFKEDLKEIYRYFDANIQQREQKFEVEYRARHKTGKTCWFLARGKFDYGESGERHHLLGVNVDVTPLKQAQEALRESELRYQVLVDHLPLGMLHVLDRDFRYIFSAGEAMQTLGLGGDEFLGKSIYELLSADEAAIEEIYLKQALAGQSVKYEGHYKNRPFLVQATPLLNKQGEVENLLTLSVDISEQRLAEEQAKKAQVELKRLLDISDQSRLALLNLLEDQRAAEEQIRRLNQSLEERVRDRTAQLVAANKELESFAHSVSHDLRAPLRAIDGFSEALWNEFSDHLPSKGLHYLTRIRQGSERMSQLIEDLLNLSRVTRRELERTETNLSQIAAEIAMEFQSENGNSHIKVEISPNLCAQVDPHLIRIAFENLFSNAFKFTKPNPSGVIEFRSGHYKGEAVYYIRDNGVGFDMAYAERLFTPFQRMHSEEEFPGTGVGLATVKRIVGRHGGKIWTESARNQGATFYFTLGDQQS